jgi:hypothetical protein
MSRLKLPLFQHQRLSPLRSWARFPVRPIPHVIEWATLSDSVDFLRGLRFPPTCDITNRPISALNSIFVVVATSRAWGPFPLYSLDKIQLLRIMLSCFSQLEFPVVSGQHTISKYRNLVHMSSYIGTFFMWNQISACFIFTWPEKLIHFSVQFTWILCLIWSKLQVLDR